MSFLANILHILLDFRLSYQGFLDSVLTTYMCCQILSSGESFRTKLTLKRSFSSVHVSVMFVQTFLDKSFSTLHTLKRFHVTFRVGSQVLP